MVVEKQHWTSPKPCQFQICQHRETFEARFFEGREHDQIFGVLQLKE